MIKYFLTVLGLLAITYGVREWHHSRLVGFSLISMSVIGSVLVWMPQLAVILAHIAGVGRGADLILYCYSAISFIMILNLGLKQRELHQSLTKLARHIAISSPLPPEHQAVA
jgi:hypothetical protein